MKTYKLAELLLRRKELADKLKIGMQIKPMDLYEKKVVRKNVTETVDDLSLALPRLTLGQVTAEIDFYAHQMRLTDAAIQQANWSTEVSVPEDVMAAYPMPAEYLAPAPTTQKK